MSEELELRPYRPGDDPGLLELHNAVFAAGNDLPPRTLEHWNWKFHDNPVGTRHIVVGVAGGRIVGSYTALPAHVRFDGARRLTDQGVDFVVLPEYRRRPSRPGMFVHLSRMYMERFCGTGPDDVWFTYGWPVPNWRIGRKYLDYLLIRDWLVTYRDLAPDARPRSLPGDLEVRRVERFTGEADELFETVAAEMPVMLERTSRYLNWRLADCPDKEYALFECRERSSSRLRGVCAYRVADLIVSHGAFLVEWLVPRDDHDTTVALLGTLERQGVQDGCPVLCSVWNPADPRFLHFQHLGHRVRDTGYFLVVQTFRADELHLREGWYYTMADSDLI